MTTDELRKMTAEEIVQLLPRCRRCLKHAVCYGGICGTCADDLRGERDADEEDARR